MSECCRTPCKCQSPTTTASTSARCHCSTCSTRHEASACLPKRCRRTSASLTLSSLTHCCEPAERFACPPRTRRCVERLFFVCFFCSRMQTQLLNTRSVCGGATTHPQHQQQQQQRLLRRHRLLHRLLRRCRRSARH